MKDWSKQTFKLPEKHGWKCRPGYKVFVADRGAVRFDIPQDWLLEPGEMGSIRFHDVQPPDDNCRLEMSVLRNPPGIDWTELPLDGFLAQCSDPDTGDVISMSDTMRVDRPDVEIAWREWTYTDAGEKREARQRICVARGRGLHILITFILWSSDTEKFAPAWDEVLRSLQLENYISDPRYPTQ